MEEKTIKKIVNNIEEAKKYTENVELLSLLDLEKDLLLKLKNEGLAVNRSENDLKIIKSEKISDFIKKNILMVNVNENKPTR